MKSSIILAVVVITVICLIGIELYRTSYNKVNQCGEFINGFWKADPGWCSRAGISNAYATINFFPKQKYGVIYLIMQNNEGEIVDNDSYTFKTNVSMKEMVLNNNGNTECNLMFQDNKNPVSGMFPLSCKLRIDIKNGVIALHDGTTVYLELYKDNITSSRVERMSHEKFRETYLPNQTRTDPQTEGYLPERPRSDPQSDTDNLNPSGVEGESISIQSDPVEGMSI
jgi:hypothetical protein